MVLPILSHLTVSKGILYVTATDYTAGKMRKERDGFHYNFPHYVGHRPLLTVT